MPLEEKDESSKEESIPPTKKLKTSNVDSNEGPAGDNTILSVQRNQDGESYIDLSSKKRLTVRSWKGSVLVDIREFYEKNGQLLPGSKGISLSMEQYKVIKEAIRSGTIDTMIQQKKV